MNSLATLAVTYTCLKFGHLCILLPAIFWLYFERLSMIVWVDLVLMCPVCGCINQVIFRVTRPSESLFACHVRYLVVIHFHRLLHPLVSSPYLSSWLLIFLLFGFQIFFRLLVPYLQAKTIMLSSILSVPAFGALFPSSINAKICDCTLYDKYFSFLHHRCACYSFAVVEISLQTQQLVNVSVNGYILIFVVRQNQAASFWVLFALHLVLERSEIWGCTIVHTLFDF